MKALAQTKYFKELLLSALLLTLVLGPFQPLIAQAQSTSGVTTGPTLEQAGLVTPGPTAQQAGLTLTNNGTAAVPASSNGGATNQGAAAPATQSDIVYKCSWTSSWDLCLTNVVYVFTVGIGSGFAYVAAYFFNIAVNLSLNGPAYALTFISTGWTTARDLANMAFLFILIYIAFTIILEAETSGTMSLLAGVIVIALLVNFSFFFARVVIDAGNILSIQFYNSITAPSIQTSAQTSNVAAGIGAAASVLGASNQTKDLTASIMGMLQLQNLFNTTSFQSFYDPGKTGKGTTDSMVVMVTLSFLYIAAAIMFYLITVMFVTVGVKFLMRIVVLWFLIIASPLAFVARAAPPFKKYFDQWREELVKHAFYPVAFMFIFLILTNFTNQMGNCTNNGVSSSQSCLINDIFTSLPTGASSGSALVVIGLAIANVAIRMGFVIAILYIGLKASDSVSVMGAKAAEKAGNWAGGWYKAGTSGLAARTGAFAFRESIGRAAANDIDRLKKNPPRTAFGQYFDYAYRKNVLAPIAGASLGGVKSYEDINKYRKERKEDLTSNRRAAENAEVIKTAGAKLAAGTPITNDEKNTIQRISKRELENMKVSDIKAISTVLTEDQIKKVGDIEKIAEKEREEVKANWEERSVESPLRKSVKKLEEIARSSAAAATAITAHTHTAGAMVDGAWSATLKNILQADHRTSSLVYSSAETNFRDAVRDLRNATPATLAAATAAHTAAEAAVNTAHANRQKTQDALDSYKEFDDNRKKVEPNTNINNNGVKGTFKANLI